MRRLLVLALAVGTIVPTLGIADELSTKQRIINRSGVICRDLLEAIEPHVEQASNAMDKGQLERFIRQSRLAVRVARPYADDLEQLIPPTGARRYRRFVNHGQAALDLLDAALDALEADRARLAKQRNAAALEHLARAKRAARRYGLRRSCIRVVS